jgi:hypothetical protein
MTITLNYSGGMFNGPAGWQPPSATVAPISGYVYVTIDYNGPSNFSFSLSSDGITLSSAEWGVNELDSDISVVNGSIVSFLLQLSLEQQLSSNEPEVEDIFAHVSFGTPAQEYDGLETWNIDSGGNTTITSWGLYSGPAGLLTSTTVSVTINGTVGEQAMATSATIDPFSKVTITDSGTGQTETVTVALAAAANGTLSNLDGGSYNASTGVYTDTGTAAAVTTALDGLVFAPTANQVASGQTVTTTFTITDTDTAGATATDSTTSVIATAGTVAPTITGTVAGQTVTDPAIIPPFSNVVITDPNIDQTETVTVALSASANGILINLDGGTYDAVSGVYTDTGAAASVTTALDGLVFTPTPNQVAPGQSVTTTFTITDTDTAGAAATDSTTTVIATAGTLWPTDPLMVTLESGGDWSVPDDDGDSTYTGTVDIGLDGGETVLSVQGATVERDEDDLVFSGDAVAYALIGGILVPSLQGPFDLTYADAQAVPEDTQPSYLSQLPVTVKALQIDPSDISISYAMSLPGTFNSITVPDLSPDGAFDLTITNSGYVLGGSQGSITLPSVNNANFFNLFTTSFAQGAISVTPTGAAVLIQGEIVTAAPVSDTISSTVTLNVAGPNNFISISDNAGTFTYGASFSFTAANWVLPGGWSLQNIGDTVSTQTSTIRLLASLIPTALTTDRCPLAGSDGSDPVGVVS